MNDVPSTAKIKGLNSRSLARLIFKSDLPEQYIQTVPAQSLYMAIKQQGLASSADILEIASVEQCRLLLDFDLWKRDDFNEENFWEWLGLADENHGFELLQKILKCIDLKLVALMISRYVEVETYEEPTSNPPAVNYSTPDSGHTWIRINIEDGYKHFNFARFLALIFETSAEVFYQLLATPSVSTFSMLQEESYQDKSKRLCTEGIPTHETAEEINSGIREQEIIDELKSNKLQAPTEQILAIQPLVYEAGLVQPLAGLINEIKSLDEFESEFTLIANSAIVFWEVDYSDKDEVANLIGKIKGAINISLEYLSKELSIGHLEIYNCLRLQKLYRLGLEKLFMLRRQARKLQNMLVDETNLLANSPELALTLEALALPFPEMPSFHSSTSLENSVTTEISTVRKAIEHFVELEKLAQYISSHANQGAKA